jgi:hypothetical protein
MGLALDDEIFSSESYDLPIPKMDGYKAAKLKLSPAEAEFSTERASTTLSSSKLDGSVSLSGLSWSASLSARASASIGIQTAKASSLTTAPSRCSASRPASAPS